MKQIRYNITPMFGSDPEFFFTTNGQVVGSEKIIPPAGILTGNSKFVIDGVQAELNPSPNTCRANFGNEISRCFRELYNKLKAEGKNVEVSFNPLVNITQEEMDSLSEKSRQFGCAPSLNAYTGAESKIKVDAAKYLCRSAGGHIHIGHNSSGPLLKILHDVQKIVPFLDLMVGNTCVLIDRDESNVERRRVYGRCGEFRTKPYGLEYRTLSNFWLRSYQLMSLVLGITRFAVNVVWQSDQDKTDYVQEFMSKVKTYRVKRAINRNDFDLAMENFERIRPLWEEATSICQNLGSESTFSISCVTMHEFLYFVSKIKESGLEYWFKDSPLQHWTKLPDGHHCGWESFSMGKVREEMIQKGLAKSKNVTKEHCGYCGLELIKCENKNNYCKSSFYPSNKRTHRIWEYTTEKSSGVPAMASV